MYVYANFRSSFLDKKEASYSLASLILYIINFLKEQETFNKRMFLNIKTFICV